MKKLTILSLAIAMVAISVSAADNAKPKRAKVNIPADVLKKYDKNNDGKVNKDDNLSKEEMASFRAEMKKVREGGKEAPAPAK